MPAQFRDVAQARWLERAAARARSRCRARAGCRGLVLALALALLWLAPAPFWQNDLAALTPVPPALLQREGELRGALGAPDIRYLLVLDAADDEQLLALSERIDATSGKMENAAACRRCRVAEPLSAEPGDAACAPGKLPDRARARSGAGAGAARPAVPDRPVRAVRRRCRKGAHAAAADAADVRGVAARRAPAGDADAARRPQRRAGDAERRARCRTSSPRSRRAATTASASACST